MASENNNFQSTVNSLFKGMDSFITTKTVVGDAITVGDTIILPLVDVTFGVAATAKNEDKKTERRRWHGRKNESECRACDPERDDQTGQCQKSGRSDQDPGYGSGFC